MTKQGYSTGFGWIILIIFLFGFGLVYIVLNQAMVSYIQPMAGNLLNSSTLLNSSQIATSQANMDKYSDFWQFIPYILLITLLFVAVYGAIKNQGASGQ